MIEMANIGIFAVLAVIFATVTLSAAWLLRARARVQEERKMMPYECGILPSGGTDIRIHLRFYTFALLFVLFDVETLYIFPWAVKAKEAGAAGLLAIGIFAGMLLLGLFYAWRKGALEWE
ncbi:MAG: NADH-quinone oxidoreductase subunit A [Elusimicrobia bacterium]|nr:NADH-quinone oxidoreductase subunit A [Elusimicrobiota bacterium]